MWRRHFDQQQRMRVFLGNGGGVHFRNAPIDQFHDESGLIGHLGFQVHRQSHFKHRSFELADGGIERNRDGRLLLAQNIEDFRRVRRLKGQVFDELP